MLDSKVQLLTSQRTNREDRSVKCVCVCVSVSHLYGFGLLDAENMVTEAERWNQVPPQRECVEEAPLRSSRYHGDHTFHFLSSHLYSCPVPDTSFLHFIGCRPPPPSLFAFITFITSFCFRSPLSLS